MAWNFFKYGPRPVLIAHRGASGYTPENTLIAFKLALDMGVKFMEMDVHQTKDGHPLVIHDDNLKRVAGIRKKVQDLTLEEIRKYSIGTGYDFHYNDERIPTLEEALSLIARRAVIDVEIKGKGEYAGLEERIVTVLERKGYNGMSFVSSSSPEVLHRVRSASSTMPLGFILGTHNLKEAMHIIRELGCQAIICASQQATKSLIQKAHQRALHVCVYTINDRKKWLELTKRRVDAMFTDFPDLNGVPEFEQASLGLTNGE